MTKDTLGALLCVGRWYSYKVNRAQRSGRELWGKDLPAPRTFCEERRR
jgi:hypothetical protein